MYKVIVGFNFSSLAITVDLVIKAMDCNIIMKPLECGKHFTIVCRSKCYGRLYKFPYFSILAIHIHG